ncbi:hypothetical protein M3J07_013796 [Ascochyta lentis]
MFPLTISLGFWVSGPRVPNALAASWIPRSASAVRCLDRSAPSPPAAARPAALPASLAILAATRPRARHRRL